jgi:hypothetical protein
MNTNQELTNELTRITVNGLVSIFNKTKTRIQNFPKPTTTPKLIIKYGPPASGKGSAEVRKLIESFGDPLSSYININIDDVVESTSYFKKKSKDLVKKFVNNPNNATLTAFLNTASVDEVKNFAKVYTNVRFAKNRTGQNIGSKMDILITQAIENGKNITFETTGTAGFPEWIWKIHKVNLIRKEYEVIIIFPTVDFETTWIRYKKRPINSLLTGRGGFRFASTKNQLSNVYKKSYNFMINAINKNGPFWVDSIYIINKGNTIKVETNAKNMVLNILRTLV